MKKIQISRSKDWAIKLLTKPNRRFFGFMMHTPKPINRHCLPHNTCALRKVFIWYVIRYLWLGICATALGFAMAYSLLSILWVPWFVLQGLSFKEILNTDFIGFLGCFILMMTSGVIVVITIAFIGLLFANVVYPWIINRPFFTKQKVAKHKEPSLLKILWTSFKDKVCHQIEYID